MKKFQRKRLQIRNIGFLLVMITASMFFSCEKDDDDRSERFILLTSPVWVSESLLVNGVDASGPDQLLEDFNGEVKFNEDGTGRFGDYTGTWNFTANETQLVISTSALPFPITAGIEELTSNSLKIETNFDTQAIRMTFKVK